MICKVNRSGVVNNIGVLSPAASVPPVAVWSWDTESTLRITFTSSSLEFDSATARTVERALERDSGTFGVARARIGRVDDVAAGTDASTSERGSNTFGVDLA